MPPKLKQIVADLQKLAISPQLNRAGQPKRRRRRRPRARGSLPGGNPGVVRGQGTIGSAMLGAFPMAHCEFWGTLALDKGAATGVVTFPFVPGKSGIPVLDKLGAVFERYQVHSCTLHWRTTSGTTRNGAVVVGVDWDPKDSPGNFQQVAALAPNCRGAVWSEFNLPLPPSKLMSRTWLMTGSGTTDRDEAAFAVSVAVQADATTVATTYGDLWVTYKVTLQGPTAKNA